MTSSQKLRIQLEAPVRKARNKQRSCPFLHAVGGQLPTRPELLWEVPGAVTVGISQFDWQGEAEGGFPGETGNTSLELRAAEQPLSIQKSQQSEHVYKEGHQHAFATKRAVEFWYLKIYLVRFPRLSFPGFRWILWHVALRFRNTLNASKALRALPENGVE